MSLTNLRFPLLLSTALMTFFPPAFAANTSTATVKVSVNVIAPIPCTISGGKTISVDFKTMDSDKIDGNNFKKPINYSIECNSWSDSRQVTLTLIGEGAQFNTKFLSTDLPVMGIKFLADDQPFDMNKPLVLNYPTQPKLEAVPVKNAVTMDPEDAGAFHTSVILKLDVL